MTHLLRLVDTVDEALDRCVARHPATRFGPTQREAEIADDLRGYDPACRYAANPSTYPTHTCVRNTGEEIRLGETCYFEANAKVHEQSPEWVCTSCGFPIAVVGGRGTVTRPDGRSYRFHAGDCFLEADDAIARAEARQ